jgi:glycogen operon protein
LTRSLDWADELFGYEIGHPDADLSFDARDSAGRMPKGIIVDPAFTWGADKPPGIHWHETIIYEAHVRGMTMRHPAVEKDLKGTFEGLATPAVIDHLLTLGITSIELMPVHHFVSDRHLIEAGLRNFWGYNSVGFFAPDVGYSRSDGSRIPGHQAHEFKSMVKSFHDAGIEVILDVVYNHTAEGNHLGPTLSFRGIDNASYYRLAPNNARYYYDFTGCGNSLNMRHPRVLQLIMDSLRYWIQEMHVDGFRFDLASTLARELHEVDKLGAFFDIILQDPLISRTKNGMAVIGTRYGTTGGVEIGSLESSG